MTLQLPNRLVLTFNTIGSFIFSSFEKMTNEIKINKLIRLSITYKSIKDNADRLIDVDDSRTVTLVKSPLAVKK